MKKTRFNHASCPIARTLDRIGEWWSILIVRDAFHGLSKFDEFQQSLGLSPTLLTRRLKHLVAGGILYKQRYQTRPVRYDYLLTERGKDLFPVLVTLFHWGNTHLAEGGIAAVLVDRRSDQPIQPELIDALTQQPVTAQYITLAPGPAAGEAMIRRSLHMRRQQALVSESYKESS